MGIPECDGQGRIVREIDENELDTFLDILRTLALWLQDNGQEMWSLEGLERDQFLQKHGDADWYICDKAEEPVGVFILQEENPFWWPNIPLGETVFLKKFGVPRKHSGKGIAADLLQWVKQEARARGKDYIRLEIYEDREPLVRLYEGSGFQRVELRIMPDGTAIGLYEYKLPELFDIFDEHMQKMGTVPRPEVHRLGYWHQTFHCWVLSPSESGRWKLLLQKRHPDKDTFPGFLDISCAGHLSAGESVEDGVRELQEELGLEVPFQALYSCGIFPEEMVSENLIDREFCHIFLHQDSRPLREYVFQRSEITGLFEVDLDDFRQLVEGSRETVKAYGVEVDAAPAKDAAEVATDGKLVEVEREFSLSDVCPHDRTYYEFLFSHMKRYLS
ncbi:bifunctional GNAT family N-acetyltransferase/NUDIX hydrolase [Gorillibacterium massiliense]|uniref:bifunctional GNAT family N-acetyltransferase/NUDIX hydrolase n=1 Tax=Gorillibacterium massiliense TaxID=1280390 RepID=UPI0004BC5AF4|nr:bifunctional GNAT family N-acetyltransferase/NUDIX hydrolase [Gorillibacterium massiliense]